MVTSLARQVLSLGFALAAVATAAGQEPKKQPDAGELPKGAKVRLGEPRLVFRFPPSLALSPPDYKVLVVPEGPEKLRRVDIATGRALDGGSERIAGVYGNFPVVMSADGKRFISTQTGALTVRDAATGKAVKELKPPMGFRTGYVVSQPIASLSADGKVLAFGGSDMTNKSAVAVWDVDKGEFVFQTGLPANGTGIPLLSPDGSLVAVWGNSYGPLVGAKADEIPKRTVTVYEVRTGKEVLRANVAPGNIPGVSAVAFSPDGSLLAASCADGVVELWDVKTEKARPALLGRGGQGARLAFSPDGKTIAAAATDGAVQRWTVADGKPLGAATEAPLAMGGPQGLAFADNGRVVAWAMVGVCPVVWEVPSGKMLTPPPDHTQRIRSIAFAAGGKEVITAGDEGRVFRWDAATGKKLGEVALRPSRSFTGGPPRVPVNITADGTKGVASGYVGAVMDLATGTEEFAVPRVAMAGHSTSYIPSADGTKIVVFAVPYDRAKPGKCQVWDLTARQKVLDVELPVATGYPPSAAVSPSGNRLVTTAYHPDSPAGQQTLIVTGWDLKTGKKLATVEDTSTKMMAFVAAAGDEFAVVSSGYGRLKAYNYAAGRFGEELDAGKGAGESVSGAVVFSADGKRFASGASGGQAGESVVKVYEWPTGKVQHEFTGLRAPVSTLAFSPDGKTLATGSQDTTLMLWDVSEKK